MKINTLNQAINIYLNVVVSNEAISSIVKGILILGIVYIISRSLLVSQKHRSDEKIKFFSLRNERKAIEKGKECQSSKNIFHKQIKKDKILPTKLLSQIIKGIF